MERVDPPLRILVIENEPMVVQVISDIADDAGWQLIGPATSYQQALVLAATADCDCAVLDIHLDDGMTSLPAAALLRERGIPFLFASGLGSGGQRRGFETAPVLQKPFRRQSLIGAVQNLLRTRP